MINSMESFDINNLTLDDLLSESVFSMLQKIKGHIERAQKIAEAAAEKDESQSLTNTKIGTILILAVLDKYAKGTTPKNYSEEDWKDISDLVMKYAVFMEGDEYSAFVFSLYADFIDASIKILPYDTPEKHIEAIQALATELRDLTTEFSNQKIAEVAYTEKCLWIALEAMIKLIATDQTVIFSEDFTDLANVLPMVPFEYGRLKLYKEEQALLTQYLENQYVLDQELEERFTMYKEALSKEVDHFNLLIEKAFDDDFRIAFAGSANLARSIGIKEEEILDSVDKVDDFFLN